MISNGNSFEKKTDQIIYHLLLFLYVKLRQYPNFFSFFLF